MPQSGIVKYHVKLSFEVDGLVERADIIGAIFGQTEGLLGPEMNLNELQRVSKVGRIDKDCWKRCFGILFFGHLVVRNDAKQQDHECEQENARGVIYCQRSQGKLAQTAFLVTCHLLQRFPVE